MTVASRRLLAVDMDGTFIGDEEAMHALWDRLEAAGIVLAFSTGRHLDSILRFYADATTARRADACVCMVGTDIHVLQSGAYALDSRWHQLIARDWDREAVERVLRDFPEATPQDAQWQSPFKISCFLESDAGRRLGDIERRLAERGLRAKIIYSAGRFLDLLPVRSGKGEAVRYLAERLGVSPADVITAGDSGNDLDMMRAELGFRAIAVGNAAVELASFRPPHVYHARAHFAAGVAEGLEYYGWL